MIDSIPWLNGDFWPVYITLALTLCWRL